MVQIVLGDGVRTCYGFVVAEVGDFVESEGYPLQNLDPQQEQTDGRLNGHCHLQHGSLSGIQEEETDHSRDLSAHPPRICMKIMSKLKYLCRMETGILLRANIPLRTAFCTSSHQKRIPFGRTVNGLSEGTCWVVSSLSHIHQGVLLVSQALHLCSDCGAQPLRIVARNLDLDIFRRLAW